jgi:DNA-binding IclR family transcriptional regulator
MTLFEAFARERRPMTKSELARLLDLPESSTSDLLSTLFELGYVSRTVASRRFYPTGRLSTIARAIAENDQLGALAEEAVSHLAERTGETSIFAVIDGESMRVAGVAEGKHRLRFVVNVGDTFTIHGTGAGKALLGTLAPQDRARLLRLKPLKKLTRNTLTDPRDVESDIETSAKRGWYGARDEGTIGVSSIAVSGLVGSEPAALGIIGPSERIVQNEQALVEEVLRARQVVFENQ